MKTFFFFFFFFFFFWRPPKFWQKKRQKFRLWPKNVTKFRWRPFFFFFFGDHLFLGRNYECISEVSEKFRRNMCNFWWLCFIPPNNFYGYTLLRMSTLKMNLWKTKIFTHLKVRAKEYNFRAGTNCLEKSTAKFQLQNKQAEALAEIFSGCGKRCIIHYLQGQIKTSQLDPRIC